MVVELLTFKLKDGSLHLGHPVHSSENPGGYIVERIVNCIKLQLSNDNARTSPSWRASVSLVKSACHVIKTACHVTTVFLLTIGQDEPFRLEYRIAYHVTKPSKVDWRIRTHLPLHP